jgi:hypothetical protein
MTNSHYDTFRNPPHHYGAIPFWFWNDDLSEAELLRQIREFHAKGLGGFIPHARVGLSPKIGYLTPRYFELIKLAVTEAARLGMRVILYDEGSYPSGSAQGRVVAENPNYASRCIIPVQQTIQGPAKGYWHPNPGRDLTDQLLGVIAAQRIDDQLDPSSFRILPMAGAELVAYDLPAGEWQLVAVWNVMSGGTIRGVYGNEDDHHPQAPAAADLLNPDAVASFIRHTHEQYAAHVGEYFGSTIQAIFTDEPMLLGRGARRGPDPWPYTDGFLHELSKNWPSKPLPWLIALWHDCGALGQAFRDIYTNTVYQRLERVFYGAQQQWCQQHGLALTGHPDASNDLGSLHRFDWPGQDTVWRWVLPNSPSSLIGQHSCAPKVASSAAAHQNSPYSLIEVFGAYGWKLSLAEAKWLIDWHAIRGNNLYVAHAFFYSIAGRRAYESEPDLGLHNVWWPHFHAFSDYMRRLTWMLSESEHHCQIAIYTPSLTTWQAAAQLYQHQLDFNYIDQQALEKAEVSSAGLKIGKQTYRVIVCDPSFTETPEQLAYLRDYNILVVDYWRAKTLISSITQYLEPDLHSPNTSNLRVRHHRKDQLELYLLHNEGPQSIDTDISLAACGAIECWDPSDGSRTIWPSYINDLRNHTHIWLAPYQSLILAVDTNQAAHQDLEFPQEALFLRELDGWQCIDQANKAQPIAVPQDWAQQPGFETFAGALSFYTTLHISQAEAQDVLQIACEQIGQSAELFVNGQSMGVRAWPPYRWTLENYHEGENQISITVINSMANRLEGLQSPSGILAPVCLYQKN